MSKPASKTLIGAFVIGAIALAIAIVLILGSGKFFTDRTYYILYFDGTVEGLAVGSPVMFRGVKIGTVKDIGIRFNANDLSFLIPVLIEMSGKPLEAVGLTDDKDEAEYMRLLISKGLRAQLEIVSMVTGQLSVNLNFFPKKPEKLYGINKKYTEIPTIHMGLEEIAKTLQDIPYKELYEKVQKTIDGISRMTNSPDLAASMKALREGLQESVKISKTINAQLEPTILNFQETSSTMKSAFAQAEKALSGKDGVPEQMNETLKAARSALVQAEQTLIFAQKHLGENSIIMQEVDNAMGEIAKTARSVRFLTEYLETHPESVISGKKQ